MFGTKERDPYTERIEELRNGGIRYDIVGDGVMKTTAKDILEGAADQFEAARNYDPEPITPESLELLIEYIEEFGKHTVLEVVEAELGELILRDREKQ